MKKISYILGMMAVLLSLGYDLSSQNTTAPGPDTTAAPKEIVLLDNDLGSKLNPVKCDNVKGETGYLERLRDRDGNPVIYERIGHAGPTGDGHYYDKFLVKSQDGKVYVEIYLDMYCPGFIESNPIKDFRLDTRAASTPTNPQPKSVSTPGKPSPSKKTVPAKTQKKLSNLSNGIANSQNQGSSTGKQAQKEPGKEVKSQPDPDKIPGFDDVQETPHPPQKNSSPKKSEPPQKTETIPTSPAPKTTQPREEKIPGFDDVITGSSPAPQGNPSQNQTYLSVVPILDPSPGQPAKKDDTPRFTAIINRSVHEAIKTLETESNVHLLINRDNHTIHDKQQEIKKLYQLCTGSKDQPGKMEEIGKQILDPRAIDLIITGTVRYEEQTGKYLVAPIVISKPDNRLFMSKIFESDPKIKQSEIEKDVRKEIVNIVKTKFPGVFSLKAAGPGNAGDENNVPTPPQKDVYVSIIPFFDPVGWAAARKKSLPELLDEVVSKEVETVKNSNRRLEVNAPQHTVHDVKDTLKELNAILTEANLKDNDKVVKIINDLMDPKGIDYIFTAIYSEDTPNNIIVVRPQVVSKKERKIFSMNLVFQKDALLCPGAQTKEMRLCESARDNIGAALRMLLGQSIRE